MMEEDLLKVDKEEARMGNPLGMSEALHDAMYILSQELQKERIYISDKLAELYKKEAMQLESGGVMPETAISRWQEARNNIARLRKSVDIITGLDTIEKGSKPHDTEAFLEALKFLLSFECDYHPRIKAPLAEARTPHMQELGALCELLEAQKNLEGRPGCNPFGLLAGLFSIKGNSASKRESSDGTTPTPPHM